VRSAPDGYTLLMICPFEHGHATLYDTLNYNFIRDIAPGRQVSGVVPTSLEVTQSFPARTVPSHRLCQG